MKKILFSFVFCMNLFAKSSILSPLPLPENIYIDLDPTYCDALCLKNLADAKLYFSFLSKYQSSSNKESIKERYESISSLFDIKFLEEDFYYDFSKENTYVKLAVIVSKNKVKKYASSTINSIIAYLMARNSAFDIEIFNVENENDLELSIAFNEIIQKGYNVVIAPVTNQGANFIANNINDLLVFIPTIHSNYVIESMSNNVLYGGIDYNKQIKTLLNFSNHKIATFSDESNLGASLDSKVVQNVPNVLYSKQIIGEKIDLKRILKGNRVLQNASIFLNLSLIKLSLLTSQLRSYEIKPYMLLSTQISYNPLLLTLTQAADIRKMLIANSIGEIPFTLNALNELFRHSVEYDWVNYATNVGLDYIYENFYRAKNERIFPHSLDNNQIIYDVQLYKPSNGGFVVANELEFQ